MRKSDNIASEMIPIRLIISITVIAAIAVIIAIAYNNLSLTLAENQIENDCRILESELYTMVSSGIARDVDDINAGEGTKRIHAFDLPGNLIYLAFGVDPDPNNCGTLKTGLTEAGSVIFYSVGGGSKHVIWLSDELKFREGNYTDNKWIINGDGQGFIINRGGKTTLVFEFVQKNDERYILIQNNDRIEP
ncbi:MAG: hypothetical protein NTV74_05875 [Euryarchaeota archaeon]|nr:hypothetical protein [Euryarchaeota archaeon]